MTEKAASGTTGTSLRQKMLDRMRIAGLAEATQATYIGEIEELAKHYMISPAELDADRLSAWVLSGIERGLKPATTNVTVAALKFLYIDTLGCPERVTGLRARKKPRQLPRYMTDGPAARRGHRLPARLLQKHLAAAGNLAILRVLARPAHCDADPADRPFVGAPQPYFPHIRHPNSEPAASFNQVEQHRSREPAQP